MQTTLENIEQTEKSISNIELKNDQIIDITDFKSQINTNSNNKKITYGQFVRSLQYPKITYKKGGNGGFVGGWVENSRNNANVKTRSLMTIDIDDQPNDDVWGNVESYSNFGVVMYSTHSSTREKPRYRLIVPLLEDIEPREYESITRFLVDLLHIKTDKTTVELGRLMHYPTCEDKTNYEFYYRDLPFFDPGSVPKEDMEPFKQIAKFTCSGEFKKRDPRTKQNWIGAWCNIYSITDVLDTFLPDVYEFSGGDRYTYIEGSSPKGLVIYDENQHAQSFHSTDPISGMNVNSFDLIRVHKYGHMDNGTEPMKDKPSYKAMTQFCKQDEHVKAYYDEHIKFEISVQDQEVIEVDVSQFFGEKNKFLHHKFACYLVKNWNIISLDERLHIYNNGKYVANDVFIKRLIHAR